MYVRDSYIHAISNIIYMQFGLDNLIMTDEERIRKDDIEE